MNGTTTKPIASLKVLEQKRYAWRGRCVIDGANDNEDDDDEDDDHDGDDDENNEYDDKDGDDEDDGVVVLFVFSACKSLPNTPRPTDEAHPSRNRGVIHTPQPRIRREGPNNGLATLRQRDDQRRNIT